MKEKATNGQSEQTGEYFRMEPKNEILIGKPQTDELLNKALCAEADEKNSEFSQNTSTWE